MERVGIEPKMYSLQVRHTCLRISPELEIFYVDLLELPNQSSWRQMGSNHRHTACNNRCSTKGSLNIKCNPVKYTPFHTPVSLLSYISNRVPYGNRTRYVSSSMPTRVKFAFCIIDSRGSPRDAFLNLTIRHI